MYFFKKFNLLIISLSCFSILSLILWIYFETILSFPLDFDGAYNLQIPKNLFLKGFFGSNYESYDPLITTGYPVLIPIYFSFLMFGYSFLVVKFTMFSFYVLSLLCCYYITYKYTNNILFSLLSLFILFIIHHCLLTSMHLYCLGALGEVASFFYYLVAIILGLNFFSTNKLSCLLLSGIFLTLSYQSKTIMIFAVIAYLIAFIWLGLASKKIIKIHNLFIFILFFLIPIFLYNIIQLISLDYSDFINKQKQFIIILKSFGSGLNNKINLFQSLINHINIFNEQINIPFLILFLLMIILLIYFLIKIKYHDIDFIFLNLFIFSFIYFVWWFFINSTGWIRHFTQGILAIILLFILLIYDFFDRFFDNKKFRFGSYLFLIISPFLLYINNPAVLKNNFYVSFFKEQYSRQLNISNFINNKLMTSKIYYYGWWQSPEISFLSQKTFLNADRFSPDNNIDEGNFLILTQIQKALDPNSYAYNLNRCREIIYNDNNGNIIGKIFPYFYSEDEYFYMSKNINKINSELDFLSDSINGEFQIVNGIYYYTKDIKGRWINGDFSFWIKLKPEKDILIEGWIPNFILPQEISIYINDDLIKKDNFTTGGNINLFVPKSVLNRYENYSIVKIRLLSNNSIIPQLTGLNSDDRKLSLVLTKIYFSHIDGAKQSLESIFK